MRQRRLHHLAARVVLVSVLAFVVGAGFAPRSSLAQQCPTEFQEQTSGAATNGGTICQTAVGKKCTFQLELCVNQSDGSCTPKDLKKKNVRASGHCGPVGKVKVKAAGTSSVCGSFAGVKVATKKHGMRAGTCKIRAKGSTLTKLTLLCEPEGTACAGSTTTTTIAGSTTTTIPMACACGASNPTKLSFTTGIGTGNCGTIQGSTGTVTKNLACSGLYTGGGGNTVPLPYAVPDQGQSLTGVSGCSGPNLTLTNLTSTQTTTNRNCTSVGCLFGPPLPIPNSGSTPTSVCVLNVVATNASGTADCSTGSSNINLPLTSQLYLSGDLYPNAPGIQVCPVCNKTCTGGTNATGPCNTDTDCPGGGTCGGPNVCHSGGGRPGDGNACTPADTATLGTTNSFPTSQDCPPDPALGIGGLPIAFNLTTGSTSKTAVNNTASGQNNVFCGYCRDVNGTGSGCFAGDQTGGCPAPLQPSPIPCASNAACPAAYPDCEQKSAGAFGPAGGGAHTINETGSPAGNITDGLGHASTLASIFCIQPTFNATVDAAGDLPGPGAVTLSGTVQVQ
jgi:hypothetical protein